MDTVVLYSGGIDSFILWRWAGQPPRVHIDLGHVYANAERAAISNIDATLSVTSGDCVEMPSTASPRLGRLEAADGHIPYRNLALVMEAAFLWAVARQTPLNEGVRILVGATAGESSRDKSGEFIRRVNDLFHLIEPDFPVVLEAPLRHLTKTQLVRKYLEQFPDTEDVAALLHTTACYRVNEVSHVSAKHTKSPGCGACMACYRRWVAFTNNGLGEMYWENPRDFGSGFGVRPALGYLLRAKLREWPAIVRNTVEAGRAHRLGIRT